MFGELQRVLRERPITISLSMKDNVVTAIVAPKPGVKKDESTTSWSPFMVSGTPEELDRDLPRALEVWVEARDGAIKSVTQAAADAAADLARLASDEKKKKAAEVASKKEKPAAGASAKAAPVAPQQSLFGSAEPASAPVVDPTDEEDEGGDDDE